MNGYRPYEYKEKTMLIERYVILDEQPCTEQEYDIFRMKPDTHIEKRIAEGVDCSKYPVFDDLDREQFNSFRYREGADNKKYYLYTQVYSKTRTKIIVNTTGKKGKLWINGKCVSIHGERYPSQYYLALYLNKGVNHFLLEQFPQKKDGRFCIQILNYHFEMSNDFKALSNVSHLLQIDPLVFIHDPFYLPHESVFRLMCIKNNNQEYQDDYRIDIYDSSTGFVKSIDAKMNEPVHIDIDELRNLHSEVLRHERISCIFKDKNNKDKVIGLYILLNDFTSAGNRIGSQLAEASKELSAEIQEYARGKIKRQNDFLQSQNYLSAYKSVTQSKETLRWIKEYRYPHNFHKDPGAHETFIYSRLDDSYVRIGVRVPQNFDSNKAYPAFIAFATANDGVFSWRFPENDVPEPCLCFDVTGRGFTGGSYIGEACSLEILSWIRANYRIDENRLYFLGQSNGGFAAYAFAQNYPSIPAAIYPQIGYPQTTTIENISNIPTYQIAAPKDHVFMGRKNEIKNKLKPYSNYHQYDFKEMIHSHFNLFLSHKKILTAMLKHSRNKYPCEVVFKTCRNRHLESFWVKLHGIAFGKQFAKVKAKITDEKNIWITVSNAVGVTVTLPPQINKENFNIFINGKQFSFENYKNWRVNFKKSRIWELSDSESRPDYRKGTGLLDVYLNSLRMILFKGASDGMLRAAEKLAHPYTNGYEPEVYVDYPIYRESNVPERIFDHNLILFDNNYSNSYVKRFRDKLAVKYDGSGYDYRGERYDKDYVIMQVIPSPYDARLSILVVSTNNEGLLKRHLLLRKVIIPTYASGIHKYWNNEVLIFDGKNYSCAYERNLPLKQIENVNTGEV